MKGNVTMTGYWPDSPDRNNDFNIIPSNKITMNRVKKPLFGMSDTGDQRIMYPGEEHQFDGNYVLEMPLNKMKREITDPTVIQRLIDNYKQNKMRNGGSLRTYQGDENPSTVDQTQIPFAGAVPYAIQTNSNPYGWMTLPKDIGTGQAYNAYNVRTDEGPVNSAMQFDPTTGKISTGFPVTNIAYQLPEVGFVGTPSRSTGYAREFMAQNPDPNAWSDSEDPTSPVTEKFFGNLLGIGKTATNPYTGKPWNYYNRQTNWQNAKDNYIAQKLLEANPQGDRSRQEWLASFAPSELELIQKSKTYSGEVAPNKWAEGTQGMLNFLLTGPDWGQADDIRKDIPNLFPGQLSPEEKNEAGILAGMGMLSIPAEGIKGWITEGSGRGWAGASPIDYTRGRDVVADIAGEIVADPLNLIGTGAYSAPFKLAGKSAPYIRAATEIGANTTGRLLGKINPFLESKAGLLSNSPVIETRLGFGPDAFVNAMDSEAARFGSLDYRGKTSIDTYKAFAESELPLDNLRAIANQKGLSNSQSMTREEIVQAFKERARQQASVETLDASELQLLQDALFERRTGKSVQEWMQFEPSLTNRDDVYRYAGVYDPQSLLRNTDPATFTDAFNQALPNKSLNIADLDNAVDTAAGISKKAPSEITPPINKIETPEDFVVNSMTQKQTTSGKNAAFGSLFGQGPNNPGTIQVELQKLLSSGKTTGDDALNTVKTLLEQEAHNQGYSKSEINKMLTRFENNFKEGIADAALNHPTSNYSQSISNNTFMQDADLGAYAIRSELLPQFSGMNRNSAGMNMLEEFMHIANMPQTGKGILGTYGKINNVLGQKGLKTGNNLIYETLIDNYLNTFKTATEKADAAKTLYDSIENNGLDYAMQRLSSGFNQVPKQQGLNTLNGIIDNTYGKKLNTKQLNAVKAEYAKLFEDLHSNALTYGYTDEQATGHAIGTVFSSGSNLHLKLTPSLRNDTKIFSALDAGSVDNYYKPTFREDFSETLRRGRSAARTKTFITPATKEELVGQVQRGKENLVNLKNPKVKSFVPSTDPGYSGNVKKVAQSLFASSFKNSREMAMSVKSALENGFKNSPVGEVLTGSTDTSKDSYLIQMDFLMRIHNANPGSTEPVFLGFRPMNSYANVSKFRLLDTEQTLNAINSKLNSIQKQTNVNFSFEDKFPYIDNGQIMIPQWGLRKTKDETILIKKKKYGGQVEYGTRPFIGYLPFTHHQLK